jgi:hypothetical protein
MGIYKGAQTFAERDKRKAEEEDAARAAWERDQGMRKEEEPVDEPVLPDISPPPGEIYALMSKVMADVGPVAKGGRNEYDGYRFRSIDDMYKALQPALIRHNVFPVPVTKEWAQSERKSSKGTPMLHTTLKLLLRFYAPDGSSVLAEMVGEGMDRGDKATNKAYSAAMKYTAILTFQIPVESEKADSENDSPSIKASKRNANVNERRAKALQALQDELKAEWPSRKKADAEARKQALAHVFNCGWAAVTKLSTQELEGGLPVLKAYTADPEKAIADAAVDAEVVPDDEIPF